MKTEKELIYWNEDVRSFVRTIVHREQGGHMYAVGPDRALTEAIKMADKLAEERAKRFGGAL
jgi:hypothetical protein